MAVQTGTATSAADLYSKLITFLTTNAALVAADQEWAIAWDDPIASENPSDIVLRGPGLSGQDQVYVCLRLVQDVVGDTYFIQCRGATGVLPAGQHYADHINVTPNYVRMFLDAGTMQYWFVANGRRFMVVTKISTVFESLYAGLFLPYASPLSYPYPLFIGGSAGPIDPDGPVNWRSERANHTHFVEPHYDDGGSAVESSAWMLDPAAGWFRVATQGTTLAPIGVHPINTQGDYFGSDFATDTYQANFVRSLIMDAYGGDRVLIPCTLVRVSPFDQTYGILDGAFRCQGVANAAENLITVGGINHLVVQNVYRSDFGDYWAMAME